MEKQILRVEPFATYAERRKVPISLVVAHGGLVYVSQMPPYDPGTGEVGRFSVAEQVEIVIKQMEQCLQAAGSALSKVIQCTVYRNDSAHLQRVNHHERDAQPWHELSAVRPAAAAKAPIAGQPAVAGT
jgi:2-iminobutanoate/2-iminopropanoate deaminase